MARTIQTAISLYDGMTAPLQNMKRAMDIVLNSFEAMQNASGNAVDVSSIQQAREELTKAGAAFDNIEQEIRQADQAEQQFNQHIQESSVAADGLGDKLKGILATVGGIASIKMGLNWAKENMGLADVQRNAENQLAAVLSNMGATSIEVPVVTPDITDYQNSLSALDGLEVTSTANLETENAVSALNAVDDGLNRVNGFEALPAISVDTGNSLQAVQEFTDTFNKLNTLNNVETAATITVESAEAVGAIQTVWQDLNQLDGREAAVDVTANGAAALDALSASISAFPSTVGVDIQATDNGQIAALYGQIQGLPQQADFTLTATGEETLSRLYGGITALPSEGVYSLTATDNGTLDGLTNQIAAFPQTGAFTVTMNTGNAAEEYDRLINQVDQNTLENSLTLNTKGAATAYNKFTGKVDGAGLTNTLTVNTVANTAVLSQMAGMSLQGSISLAVDGVENYEALVDQIDNTQLENTLSLDTAEATADYNDFVATASDTTIPLSLEVDTTKTISAFEAITAKASEIQGRGIYGDEAMIAGAAELATYFSDTEAIMSMMDTLTNYAMGMTGGGALDASAMTQYATDIGKIMTGSYGAMTKKGFEFTDAQKAVIDGSATQAQLVEALGADYASMSEEMRAATVINDIISESWGGLYETMSNTPEGKIIQFNNAFGDLRETLGNQIYPVMVNLIDVFFGNFPAIQSFLSSITNVLAVVVQIIAWVAQGIFDVYTAFTSWEGCATIVEWIQSGLLFMMGVLQMVGQTAMDVATAIVNNWSWIGPIVYGIIAALGAYVAYLGIMKAVEIATAAVKVIMCVAALAHAAATGAEASATATATAAQYGLNTALLTCPIFWVVAGVIALIAAITAAIRATNTFGSQTTSVLGTICGMVNVVIQFFVNLGLSVANIALGIWEALGACCSNIGTAFHNVIANVQGWFYNLLSTALRVVEGICAALNKLPFVEFDYSGITAKADEYAAKSAEAYGSVEDYTSISDAFNRGFNTFDAFSTGWAQDAFNSGAAFGDGILDGIGNFIDDIGATTGMEDMFNIPTMDGMGFTDAYNLGNTLDGISNNTGNTAGNTAAMKDALDITDEELEYLRDIAEREAINRYTTAEIKVEQTNYNTVDQDVDLDGIMDSWASDFAQRLEISGEGVHV